MDYNSLLARVVDTLGAQITTAQAANLVELVEARFNRIIDHPLRETEAFVTPTGDITLPSDCWTVRDMWTVGTSGAADASLEQLSPQVARELYGNRTGDPQAFVIIGNRIDFWPTPSATSTTQVRIRYQQTIPALSSSNLSNWLIAQHPDIYYYSLLLQSEAYIVNDERLGVWKAALDEALAELTALGARQRYGVAPLSARPMRGF